MGCRFGALSLGHTQRRCIILHLLLYKRTRADRPTAHKNSSDGDHARELSLLSRTPTARAPHLHASLATEELTAVSINARVLAAVRQDGSDDLMVPPTAETDLGTGMESLSVTERVLLAVRQDEDSLRSRKTRELVLQAVRQDQKPCAVLVVTTALPAPRPSTPQWLVPLKTWRQKLVEARVAARRPADRALVLRAVRQVASSAIVPTKPSVPHVMIPAARTWRQDLAEKRAAALQGRTPRGLPEASSRPMLPTYRSAPVPVVDMSWRQTTTASLASLQALPPRQPTQSFARVKAAAKARLPRMRACYGAWISRHSRASPYLSIRRGRR